MGGTVSLNPNVLYPTLRRFEEAGAVEKSVEMQQGRPPRHVYRLLPRGEELFTDLLRDFGPDEARNAAEFQTRVAFFDLLETHERDRILDARDAALSEQLWHVQSQQERARNHWSKLVTRHLIHRLELERAWVRELRQLAGQSA